MSKKKQPEASEFDAELAELENDVASPELLRLVQIVRRIASKMDKEE